MMQTMSEGMTAAQRQHLLEQGYVLVTDLIDADTIEAVRDELHGVVDGIARDLVAEGKLPEAYSGAGFDRQLARIADFDMGMARELIARVHGSKGEGGHMGPAIFNLLSHPRLLDAVEAVVGPEIVGASAYRIRPKAPGLDRGAVPWHQDSGYFLPHCDRELILTCWIPLVDADLDNGCLYVLPGAHAGGILEHSTGGSAGYLEVRTEDLPDGIVPVPVPAPRGSVLIMTNLTPHASFMNTSDHVRWSVDLRYQGRGVPNNLDKLPGDIDPDGPEIEIACYPPEADFVLRSESDPDAVVRDWLQLKALRDAYFEQRGDLRGFPSRWRPMRDS